jgi:hypothetical protein
MANYRYRIQVGNEYTYRETGDQLDRLIRDLTGESVEDRAAEIQYNLARARGLDPPPPAKPRKAKLQEIKITLEEYTPPRKERWYPVE